MIANWLRKRAQTAHPEWVRRAANWYPPFIGAGIRIAHVSVDYHYMQIELKRTWFNQNYVGTQFGGSMYMMTDPFYMMMLIQILGPQYIVWDKAATIDFIKPGKSKLVADFRFSQDEISDIKQKTLSGQKLLFNKRVEIQDDQGVVVATVDKTLYVRLKPA